MNPFRRLLICLITGFSLVAGLSIASLPAQEKKKDDKKEEKKKDEVKKDEPKKDAKEPAKEPPKEPLKLDTPQAELKGHTYWVTRVAFSKDGKHIASASRDRTVKVWDVASGKDVQTLKGHSEDVKSLAVLNGVIVATPAGKWNKEKQQWQGEIKIWDAIAGKELRVFKGHSETIEALAVSPDAKRIASAGDDQTIIVWDADSGKILQTLKGHNGPVFGVAFSGDGKKLISGGRAIEEAPKKDDKAKKEEKKDVKKEEPKKEAKKEEPKKEAKKDEPKKDEKKEEAKKDEKKDEKKKGKAKKDEKKVEKAVEPPPAGPTGEVKIWDIEAGKALQSFKNPDREVTCVAWSSDGKHAAAGGLDGTIRIWDGQGKLLHTLKAHEGVWAVTFSPDGKRLATGGWDQRIKIWDVASGKEVRNINAHASTVTTLAFSADGQRLASGGTDNVIKIWVVK